MSLVTIRMMYACIKAIILPIEIAMQSSNGCLNIFAAMKPTMFPSNGRQIPAPTICQANRGIKYVFVKIPKITMITMKIKESFFIILTKNLHVLGKNFWINKPIPKGINKLIAIKVTCTYGTVKFARSNIVLPSKNSQSGIVPKDAKVDMAVIEMDKLIFPPHKSVQILLAPPAGLIPVRYRPSASSGFSEKNTNPRPYAIKGINTN